MPPVWAVNVTGPCHAARAESKPVNAVNIPRQAGEGGAEEEQPRGSESGRDEAAANVASWM